MTAFGEQFIISSENMSLRQSNIELLRIVSMSFIVIFHFLQWGVGIENMNPYLYQALIVFNICGVNLFVMISGYFGIKWSILSFIRLAGMIMFFSVFCLICGIYLFDMNISLIRVIKSIVLPFTSTGYWFLQCYLGLYLIAPILTKGLASMTTNRLKQLIIIMTLVTVLSCWYADSKLNADGFGIFHFIYLYIVGYGLRHIILPELSSTKWFVISILSLIADIMVAYGFDFYYNDYLNKYSIGAAKAYDNPFVICASIAMFMMFVKLKIGSIKFINLVASCSLGCYLLQDGFLRNPIYEYQKMFIVEHSNILTIIMFIISFFTFWLLAFILHRIYLGLFCILKDRVSYFAAKYSF